MNLAEWLIRRAQLVPDAPALFEGEQLVCDYAEFADRAARVAGWLREQSVAPGDRVAIFMQNCPAYLVVFYGIWMAGAAVVPINAKLHAREAAFILEDAGAEIVFASEGLAGELDAVGAPARVLVDLDPIYAADPAELVPRSAEDLAWLFYTSGTTGKPKGVVITFGMILSMALCYEVDVDRVSARDAAIYAAPMSHGAGLYNVMHVRAGARHVCPASGGFDGAEVLDLAGHFGSAHLFMAPTMVKRMTDRAKEMGRRGAGLRTIVYAGGPMYNADIIDAVDWFGPVFVQIYGQGECPMGITALSRADVATRDVEGWEARLASVGRAQAAVEVRVGGADGSPLPHGETGEIMVRGATVMPGYWQNAQATAQALRDGWLMTGDMGALDPQGYLTLTDRSKDVIITGGANVYPREVEEVLLTHPQVTEAAVVGRRHAEWGEEVVAFIVGDAEDAALDALCRAQIARFKRPRAYMRIAELPKNNYGKVLKTDLRKRL